MPNRCNVCGWKLIYFVSNFADLALNCFVSWQARYFKVHVKLLKNQFYRIFSLDILSHCQHLLSALRSCKNGSLLAPRCFPNDSTPGTARPQPRPRRERVRSRAVRSLAKILSRVDRLVNHCGKSDRYSWVLSPFASRSTVIHNRFFSCDKVVDSVGTLIPPVTIKIFNLDSFADFV